MTDMVGSTGIFAAALLCKFGLVSGSFHQVGT